MIKVECVSCKAPYELDPRRIPDKGMKMRCPKCGASFMVSNQGATSAVGAAPAAPPPPPVQAAPAVPLAPRITAPTAPTKLGPAPAPPPPPAAPIVAPVAKLKTAVGPTRAAAPPIASPGSDRAPAGSLAPPPGTSGPEAAVRAVLAPPFAPAPAPASPGNRSAAAKGAFGATMLGAGPPQAKPAASEDALASSVHMPDDLPALKGSHDIADLSVSRIQVDELPVATQEVDLPAPRVQAGPPAAWVTGPKPAAAAPAAKAPPAPTRATGGMDFGDLDLPTLKESTPAPAPAPKVTAPARDVRAPKPPPAAPKLGGGGFGDLDLPAPKGAADLPTAKVRADLPAVKGGAELPALRGGAELPALKGGAELPALKGGAELPALKGGAELPALKGAAELPALKGAADLPVRKAGNAGFDNLDLMAPKGSAGFGELDLVAPKADAGFGALDLPAPKNDLPTLKRDESSFADIDIDLPDLPQASGKPPAQDGFGDIELPPPKPAANLVPPKAKTVQGMGAAKAAVKDESSFGDLSLEEGDSDLPPSLMGNEESSFSDLDLTEEPPARKPAAPRPPPPARATAAAATHADEVEELEPDAEELGDEEAYEGDDFGEEEFKEGEEGEEDAQGEEMEFGISGEEGERGMSLPPEILRRQRGEEFEAKQAALGRRTITIVLRVAIFLVLLGGGGAALTFTEYGVFGIYYWERWLPEAGDPQFARDAIEKTEKMAASDSYADVRRSLKELGSARAKAGLNRLLLTRSLLHQSMFIVRFGEDTNAAAHAAAILKRLEERSWKAPGMDLARAADAARRKQWREVDEPLGRARSQAASDPYVELLAGEAALATGKLDPAEKAFGKALQLGGGARAQWGLARVALQRTDLEAQSAAINETLKLSPMHGEARLAEARIVWTQGKEERAMHLLRVALGLEPTEEDQYLWSSKQALASGYSLLGYVHESRGRLHPAREAYEQALSADPYRVEALLGSGRVLLREKRYADAQARFESALSSATKGGENPVVLSGRKADMEAKLGIGRALLALERGQEAKAKLAELTTALPNDPDVILALGESAQALGSPDVAESEFRKSITLAPKRFDGYLALAQLFFKKGDAGKASEILNEAASQVEETAEMRRMLGQSEFARNRLESAIHEFKRALELHPLDVDAMFGMAMALRKHGDLDQAQKSLEEIGKRDPGFAGLAEQSGLLFEARGDFAKAVQAYRTALEKDPGDMALLLRLGSAQVSGGDLDAAEQTLAKVIREMPNSAEAEFYIGRIAFARGRTPDALTHFDRAVSLDGTKGEYHLYVGRASLEMGNLGRTLEEIQAAMGFDPNLGDSYWVRATVRLRMGAVKDALSDLGKALKLNPSRTEAYAVQGDCYEQLRQLPDAIRAYRTALDKDPSRGEWWYRLAMLEVDSGHRSESEPAVKRALELGDKADPMPYWLPDAFRLSGENAEARNDRTSAIRLYKRYLEIASTAAIDHIQIEKKLKGWGVQLEEEQ